MGKLADRICFGVQGPRGLGLGCRSLCLAFISLWENWQKEYFLVSRAHGGWVWGAVLCVSGLYKFMGKLTNRIFFGVHGPRGLGLGCQSLCLACISLWEN